MSFLDNAGVERLWQKMKAYVALMTGSNLTFDRVYPVGSIYLSVNNVNPGTLFGGTWVAWGSGRVPVGVDVDDADFSTAEKTGGEKKHALTASEGPQHDHTFTGTAESHDHTFTGTSKSYKSGNQSANHTHGFAFNANGPNSNNAAANPGKNLSNCYATDTGTYTALGGTTEIKVRAIPIIRRSNRRVPSTVKASPQKERSVKAVQGLPIITCSRMSLVICGNGQRKEG